MRTSFGLRRRGGKMYQRKVDVDMLNAVKSVLPADVSSVSPSSKQRLRSDEGRANARNASQHILLYGVHYMIMALFTKAVS